MTVVVERNWEFCPKCGSRMSYYEKPCGCEGWLCAKCGWKVKEKTCRKHLAEMLR